MERIVGSQIWGVSDLHGSAPNPGVPNRRGGGGRPGGSVHSRIGTDTVQPDHTPFARLVARDGQCRKGGKNRITDLFTDLINFLSIGLITSADHCSDQPPSLKLVFSYNTIRDPLLSPECLHHNAQRFEFNDNTLQCTCKLQWLINAPDEEQVMSHKVARGWGFNVHSNLLISDWVETPKW